MTYDIRKGNPAVHFKGAMLLLMSCPPLCVARPLALVWTDLLIDQKQYDLLHGKPGDVTDRKNIGGAAGAD